MTWRALAFAAAALLASACSSPGRKDRAVIEYNCPANALEIEVLQRETARFQQETGIRIRLNPFSGQDKLYAMMA
ncbi:MAG TPA: hypothetical protein VMF59_11700, partial [Bacteroidota bacterium]|nr:hypothetical protein [Bacteroidota bacterium]